MTEVLSQAQIDEYNEVGGIVVQDRLSKEDLAEIHSCIAQSYEEARGLEASNARLDLEDSHSADDRTEPAPAHNQVEHEVRRVRRGSRMASRPRVLSAYQRRCTGDWRHAG